MEPVVEPVPRNPATLHFHIAQGAFLVVPSGASEWHGILQGEGNTKALQHFVRDTAQKLAADPVPRILRSVVQGDGDTPLSECYA